MEIRRRWFVWTAAGLRVHPVTWAETTTPRSGCLWVSRPNAQADIVFYADGWTETAVRRPDADAAVCATAQVDSPEAFGLLLDRVVELITWTGIAGDDRRADPVSAARPPRAADWVLGFDGVPLPTGVPG